MSTTSQRVTDMSISARYLDYVLDQLQIIGPVRARRMFGGSGLYSQDVFFGLIADDVLYFKVDDSNRSAYTARGSQPFRPVANDPSAVSLSYYQVPEDVLEDPDELKTWARKSIAIAAARAAMKAQKDSPRARKKKSRKR